MQREFQADAKLIVDGLRGLASRGPDSAINMQLQAKINELQRLFETR